VPGPVGSPVLGIVGRSGSGKTTLITALIGRLRTRGIRVSTVKHTHHGVDLDRPGKDSWLHREAGAHEVLLAGEARWALLHERRDAPPADLAALLARLEPVGLVLVEGFARYPFPRLEVQRAAVAELAGKQPLWPGDPAIEAVASDRSLQDCNRVCLPLHDTQAIAAWVVSRFDLLDQVS
jgi:molybdopterin-guanine dinucleotide biosynthesis protein B